MESKFYAVKDRTSRVYHWMNEPFQSLQSFLISGNDWSNPNGDVTLRTPALAGRIYNNTIVVSVQLNHLYSINILAYCLNINL